jgi:hypothetical protein
MPAGGMGMTTPLLGGTGRTTDDAERTSEVQSSVSTAAIGIGFNAGTGGAALMDTVVAKGTGAVVAGLADTALVRKVNTGGGGVTGAGELVGSARAEPPTVHKPSTAHSHLV